MTEEEILALKGFKMLFALMVALALVGTGAITMSLAQEPVMRGAGATVAITGAALLFIIGIMVVYDSGSR